MNQAKKPIEFFHQHGLVRMAAVRAATQRVQVGSAIAYALLRTPMLAASGAMNIDEISNGRCILYHSILDVSGWREIGETIAMKAGWVATISSRSIA